MLLEAILIVSLPYWKLHFFELQQSQGLKRHRYRVLSNALFDSGATKTFEHVKIYLKDRTLMFTAFFHQFHAFFILMFVQRVAPSDRV